MKSLGLFAGLLLYMNYRIVWLNDLGIFAAHKVLSTEYLVL